MYRSDCCYGCRLGFFIFYILNNIYLIVANSTIRLDPDPFPTLLTPIHRPSSLNTLKEQKMSGDGVSPDGKMTFSTFQLVSDVITTSPVLVYLALFAFFCTCNEYVLLYCDKTLPFSPIPRSHPAVCSSIPPLITQHRIILHMTPHT
jgi:hypothetical protein